MSELMGTQSYVMYRGRQYVELSSGKGCVIIRRSPDSDDQEFPDATWLGGPGYEERVELPLSALSARWRETVYGEWRGASVVIERLQWDGKVSVYTTSKVDGERLSMDGNQYDGWLGWAPIDEVTVTSREVHELPHGGPRGQTGVAS